MDPNSYKVGLDPVPFIAAAYILGFVVLFGYAALQIFYRRKLTKLIATLRKGEES